MHQPALSLSLRQAVEQGRVRLQSAGIDSPKLCAEVLLASVLDLERISLLLYRDRKIEAQELRLYYKLVERCALREPVAYLTGKKEFFGRDFYVNKDVLIPRPETEELAETVFGVLEKNSPSYILDIGTGSGALAVTLGLHFPQSKVIGLDISQPALAVARKNAAIWQGDNRIYFCQANLYSLPFAPLSFDCVVTNPPYISTAEFEQLPETVAEYEPRLALVSGPTGLECYQTLSSSVFEILRPDGYFFAEIGWQQKKSVLAFFSRWRQARILADLAGKDRILIAQK